MYTKPGGPVKELVLTGPPRLLGRRIGKPRGRGQAPEARGAGRPCSGPLGGSRAPCGRPRLGQAGRRRAFYLVRTGSPWLESSWGQPTGS